MSTELHKNKEDSKRPRLREQPLSSAQRASISGHNTSVIPSTSATDSAQLGERRKLLRQPVTWSSELADQAEGVRAHGCRRSRRRPTEPKLISLLKRPTSTKKAS
ncbi:hypothetical protein PHET_07447 [Paragonimus heterotremus]|uniref:Uncharacterized protein n=1 Tax=Paragonimus heterotremus TaxID=100268 RepID=A0A8J4SMM0_9TREM|nr:hypothetical protein PHET_07447 [Paragonimus heterotremus]